MSRLVVHVEGETEESFVNELLRSHLVPFGYENVSARLLGNSRLRSRRGGIRSWPSVKKEIVRRLKEDGGCIATTMVDYYAMPRLGHERWPGRAQAIGLAHENKAAHVEAALSADLVAELGDDFNPQRFVPFVIIHEFEGLLFSDCAAFARGIGRDDVAPAFQAIRDQFDSPEEIDDSPQTAPSKRIVQLIPDYQKTLLGPLAALEIGLNRIRAECPNFRNWIGRLEALGAPAADF